MNNRPAWSLLAPGRPSAEHISSFLIMTSFVLNIMIKLFTLVSLQSTRPATDPGPASRMIIHHLGIRRGQPKDGAS